nr:MAG TPA: hypothetical protein [Caudoviricetes sp.]
MSSLRVNGNAAASVLQWTDAVFLTLESVLC